MKNVNFAYVRSLIPPILASLAALAGLAAAPASAQPSGAGETSVTIALLPQGTGLLGVASEEGMAPGFLSAGIGRVPGAQTHLDITQGNRVSQALYDRDLPFLRFDPTGVLPRNWEAIRGRAESAPARIVPGLLASTLTEAGMAVAAEADAGLGRLIAADRDGRVLRVAEGNTRPGCCALRVAAADSRELRGMVERLRGDDLLIAIERPPPAFRTLTIGIAGSGFDGLLTSDSTRTDGLVTTTDIGPTVLERLGIGVPEEMNGRPIRGSGAHDVQELQEFGARLEVTGERRGPVVGQTLLAWVLLAGAVALLARRLARPAVSLLCLSILCLPLVLLVAPAFDPSLLGERLLAGLGAPLVALAAWRLVGGWPALALVCLVGAGAYAADVLAGSILVPMSIPGPNPASGSRFYGIGNEIEATVAALVPLGMGALLASLPRTRGGGRAAAGAFLAVGLAAAAAFALGRFGADVGAAIVLPTGAAVAAAVALGTRRGVAIAVLAPIGALIALMAADLVFGGDAHLTRSLLDAGGLDDAGDVFERRIRLAGASFTKGANLPFLALAVAVIAAGIWKRRALTGWFAERAALAGFAGALAATAIGTVSNDSGVILLILGTAYCMAAAGYAWAINTAPGTRVPAQRQGGSGA